MRSYLWTFVLLAAGCDFGEFSPAADEVGSLAGRLPADKVDVPTFDPGPPTPESLSMLTEAPPAPSLKMNCAPVSRAVTSASAPGWCSAVGMDTDNGRENIFAVRRSWANGSLQTERRQLWDSYNHRSAIDNSWVSQG